MSATPTDAPTPALYVPPEPGEIRHGVQILPDTVPDRVPNYFKRLIVGLGQSRSRLKLLDKDLREAIVLARGRAPTLGELLVVSTILRCELEVLLAEKWSRENQKDLGGQINMAERSRKASIERDKHFEKLGLGGHVQTSLAAILYGTAE